MKTDDVLRELLQGGHIEIVKDRREPARLPDKRFCIGINGKREKLAEKVFYALRRREFIVSAGRSPNGDNIELFKLNARDLFKYL